MTTFPKYNRYKDSSVEWLGEIPEHWEVCALRAAAALYVEKNQPNLPVLSVYREYGVIHKDSRDDNHNATSLDTSNYKVVRPGDLAVNKMKAWQGSLGVSEHHGIVSPAYITCRLNQEKVTGRYIHYLLRSKSLIGALDSISYGVRDGQWDMRFEDFKKIAITIPPKSEQDRIVAFLDHKTEQIDALIAKKQRQIELLDEQKAILINRAVTRGLNPNAKLKPSGIEWLPEIPEDWTSIKLRHLAALIQTGPFGSQLHSEEYVENGTPVINPSHMRDARIIPDFRCTITDKKVTALSRHKLMCEDIVFARRGELGRCGLVTQKEEGWICGTGSLLMRPKRGYIDSEYLALALSDPHVGEVLTLQSVGSTMDNLNTGMISNLAVPMPPKMDQAEIVKSVHKTETALQKLRLNFDAQIQSLKTLRSTFITHAVTGRIKLQNPNN